MNDRIGYRLAIVWFVCLALGFVETGLAVPFLTDRKGTRTLPLPDKGESFSFVVLADTTDGPWL